MSKCKKCGNEEFLRKGLCYKCYKKDAEIVKRNNPVPPIIYKKTEHKASSVAANQNIIKNENTLPLNNPKPETPLNILVVDDERSVQEAFKMILIIKNYNVDTAEDNKTAIEKLQSNSYDIVFTDNNHPRSINFGYSELTEGLTLLRYIKEKYPKTEVIIVTAYATEKSVAEATRLGAFEYLRKPFLMDEIYELVDRAIEKRSQKSNLSSKTRGN